MFVQQFFVRGIAHSSYLLGGSETCAIVDPRRDVHIYIDAARRMGMTITHVLETHLHADFVSGHRDLAEVTGAPIYAPKAAGCAFDHIGLSEGDTIEIEDMRIEVLETPGHTPEHICYVVTDRARGIEPACIFCGDTLFVGDVGRPDLFPGRAGELAARLYKSLHEKVLRLPDFCEVYPAHGAGSLCGRSMGAKRTSTIGYERRFNQALRIADKEAFVESLTANMPPAPDHFSRCSEINRKGPALTGQLPRLEELGPSDFDRMARKDGAAVLDVRSYDSFGGQHVPEAYNIDIGGNFATFAGWVIPPDRDILLVADTPEQATKSKKWLARVGLDRVAGFLDGGMFAWSKAGLHAGHVRQISAQELYEMGTGGSAMTIVDVRSPSEYGQVHIDGAINIPVADLRTRHRELDPGLPTVLICSTGHRSSLGASILKQHGFREVINTAGGMTGYSAAGYATECPVCFAPHGPHFLGSRQA